LVNKRSDLIPAFATPIDLLLRRTLVRLEQLSAVGFSYPKKQLLKELLLVMPMHIGIFL
jgi:hypothetical protein